MKRIKLLPENLINQIAAGEVIERPASVVKELLENSIDAGAAKIEVEISNECKNIRIADNGHGIPKEDIGLAFSRHATSKLTREKDLWSISTLGFRGEALASIISVAKVSCITKTADEASGIKVECENSEIKLCETGCANGTVMEIRDLFYNVPARMKFLKNFRTEFANIIEIVQSIAIGHTNISISLIHKGHTTLKTTGSNNLAIVLNEIYSKELINELSEIYKEDSQANLKVKGYVSNPDFTKSTRKAIYLFINGRMVRCPILLKAIDSAYKDIIPGGRFPFAVIDLIMPMEEIDVNVHPSKREVRYANPNRIFNFVQSAIKASLESTLFTKPAEAEISTKDLFEDESIMTTASYKPAFYEPESSSKSFFPVELPKVNFNEMRTKIEKSIEFFSPVQSKIKFPENTDINKPKIIGQLFNTYIIIETPDGLQIIDQHIAHERIIYEKLKSGENFAAQLLLTSQPVELEPIQLSLLEENKEILSKFGYEYEIITERKIVLKQIPQIVTHFSPEKIINDILESLEGSLEHIENEILITTACHAAVKANEKLLMPQMEELIADWQKCLYPKTCPHGRKIGHIISSKDIAGFFGRISE